MKTKFYMGKREEYIYNAKRWQEIANDEGEVEVEECRRLIGDVMWCKTYGEHVERGDGSCGNLCPDYDPCNGKSGRCRDLTWSYEGTGKMVVFKPYKK